MVAISTEQSRFDNVYLELRKTTIDKCLDYLWSCMLTAPGVQNCFAGLTYDRERAALVTVTQLPRQFYSGRRGDLRYRSTCSSLTDSELRELE